MPPVMPTYHDVAKKLRAISKERSEWAGLPMLSGDDNSELVLEPRFPYQFKRTSKESDGEYTVVNEWYSDRYRGMAGIARRSDGKLCSFVRPNNQASKVLATLGVSHVWLPEAEAKANEKLAQMIAPHMMNYYRMVGCILETSKRSGVTYMFRKLRPTLAIRPNKNGTDMRVLCALCLHPIGYYSGTWAGVMVPTDDVIAHLVMMRGSEEKFWAHANQHCPTRPESGL